MQTYHRRCVNDCVGKSIELEFTNLLEAEDDITKGVYLCVWILLEIVTLPVQD